MPDLRVTSAYRPTGDQPRAIGELAASLRAGNRGQTLLGATGTGKTATMAWVMEELQRPALVIAHNKTLAAQLCNEFREFFPENAVEYFVSYYDYYQPEAYVPQADLYIEKDSSQNDDIARLRLGATSSLAHAARRRRRRLGELHLRARVAGGVAREGADPRGGHRARPRRDAPHADRLAVRPQRHRPRPWALSRARAT